MTNPYQSMYGSTGGPMITPKTMTAAGQGGAAYPPYLQMRTAQQANPFGSAGNVSIGGQITPPSQYGMGPQQPGPAVSRPVVTPKPTAPGDTVAPNIAPKFNPGAFNPSDPNWKTPGSNPWTGQQTPYNLNQSGIKPQQAYQPYQGITPAQQQQVGVQNASGGGTAPGANSGANRPNPQQPGSGGGVPLPPGVQPQTPQQPQPPAQGGNQGNPNQPGQPAGNKPPQAGGNSLSDVYNFFKSDLENQRNQALAGSRADAAARGVFYGTPLTGSEADINTQYLRGLGQLQSGMYGNEQQNQLARLGLATSLGWQNEMTQPGMPGPVDYSGLGALFGSNSQQGYGTNQQGYGTNPQITPKGPPGTVFGPQNQQPKPQGPVQPWQNF